MNMHRNPCGFCGQFDHFTDECYLTSPSDFAPEPAAEPRPEYVPDPDFVRWCEDIDAAAAARVNEQLAPRRVA